MTARIMREIFAVPLSYQTVLNYAEAAAWHCHRFNSDRKGPTDSLCAGDETYIKIAGRQAYTFFFLDARSRKIIAYHVGAARDTLNAVRALGEVVYVSLARRHRPRRPNHPHRRRRQSRLSGRRRTRRVRHFLNQPGREKQQPPLLSCHQVLGLQNLDDESERWRPFKQMIERLNRTYKFHTVSLARPRRRRLHLLERRRRPDRPLRHLLQFPASRSRLRDPTALYGQVPVPLDDLRGITTLQAKWCKILQLAMAPAAAAA